MSKSIKIFDNKESLGRVIFILIIILISFYQVVTLTPKGVATTPDSLAYMYAANSIAQNGSISVPDFKLENDAFEKFMTDWPPLYPALLSLMITDNQPEESIWLFNGIALSALAVFFMLSISNIKNHMLSVFCILILLFQPPVMTVYTYAWSETLFLPMLMAAYFFTRQYIKCKKLGYLFCAVMALVASCYTRYVGIIFLLPMVLMLWKSEPSLQKRITISLSSAAVALLALMPIYILNFYVEDSAANPREESTDNVFTNLGAIGDLLGQHLLGISSWYASATILILVIAGIYFLPKKIKNDGSIINTEHLINIVWPLLWAMIYLVALVVLRTWKDFDVLDTRLISPAILFILLSFANSMMLASECLRNRWVLWVLVGCGLNLLLLGVNSYSLALSSWRNQASPFFKMNDRAAYSNFTANPGFLWMVDIYEKIKIITNNKKPMIVFDGSGAMIFRHLTNANVKWLPAKLNEEIIEKINKNSDGVLIVMTPAGISTLTEYYGSEVWSMSALPELVQHEILVIKLPLPASGRNKK